MAKADTARADSALKEARLTQASQASSIERLSLRLAQAESESELCEEKAKEEKARMQESISGSDSTIVQLRSDVAKEAEAVARLKSAVHHFVVEATAMAMPGHAIGTSSSSSSSLPRSSSSSLVRLARLTHVSVCPQLTPCASTRTTSKSHSPSLPAPRRLSERPRRPRGRPGPSSAAPAGCWRPAGGRSRTPRPWRRNERSRLRSRLNKV